MEDYSWSTVKGGKKRYSAQINATEIPQLFLELMEDQYTSVSHIQARRPIAMRLEVNPHANLKWDSRVETRLKLIGNHVENNDDVEDYGWSQIRNRSSWYGIRINAIKVPQKFLNLIEDQYTDVDYIQSRRSPVSVSLEVRPRAEREWDYERLLR